MAENLIRLKQLNQPEITGLFQNIISSNSYALTYNGGTGLNISNVGGINLNNLTININSGEVNFSDTRLNLSYEFPPATGVRRYFPANFLSSSINNPISGLVGYFPFLLQKRASSPSACIELNSYASNTTIKIGIYSGNNGLEGAKLFWEDSVQTTNSSPLGIIRRTIPYTLKEGPYILASMNTDSSNSSSFRSINASLSRLIFGENTGLSTLGAPTTATTVAFYTTGISLPLTIGTGFWAGSSAGYSPLICLEY